MVFRVLSIIGVIALFVSGLAAFPTPAQNPRIELAVDTNDFNQDGLLAIFGGLRLQGEIGLPVGAGDINGDGRADIIFCGMYGSAGPGTRRNNGQVNFYLSDGRDSGFIDAADPASNILTLFGADSGDLIGTSVATGDTNGDGIRDVALGAFGDDGPNNSRFNAGATYIVLGSPNFNLKADLSAINVNGVPPPGIIVAYGSQANGRNGVWVDIADLDGDGFGDVIMGADQINSGDRQHTGGACVLFGGPALPQVIDLQNLPPGVRMTRIVGNGREEHMGAALHASDLNGDGFADIAIGASIFRDSGSYVTPDDQVSGHNDFGGSFDGRRARCGEVYVLWGSQNWPAVIDLSNRPANSARVIGANSGDMLGSQIHSGDLNGDGKRDLIIGALQALAPDNRGRTGAVYVIYSSEQIAGAVIDLADPAASGFQITTVYGENNLDCGGDSVRSFDINNDGLFDLFVGSPEHTFELNGELREDTGDTKLIFGRRDFLPPVIMLYDPPAGLRVFRLAGADGDAQGLDGGDEFSYRLTGGDVDGDGYFDYVSNAMHGDGFGNRLTNAGELYVFSGRKLSAKLGMLPPDPEPAPVLASSSLSRDGQTVQEAPAGQSGLRVTVTGEGFRPDTEVRINGAVVVARIPNDPQLAATQRIVELDDNPAIKNSVGPLAVRVRHTNPPSELSNEVIAGRLVGPEITAIDPKRKSTGKLVLRIAGRNFQGGATATVLGPNDQPVRIKAVVVQASDSVKVTVRASDAPPSGTPLRVRVVINGIQSNEVIVTTP